MLRRECGKETTRESGSFQVIPCRAAARYGVSRISRSKALATAAPGALHLLARGGCGAGDAAVMGRHSARRARGRGVGSGPSLFLGEFQAQRLRRCSLSFVLEGDVSGGPKRSLLVLMYVVKTAEKLCSENLQFEGTWHLGRNFENGPHGLIQVYWFVRPVDFAFCLDSKRRPTTPHSPCRLSSPSACDS